MIVCASRRTDIPAFHSEWLMNRIREGYVLVRNPIAKNVVYRIDLTQNNLDFLWLMTKNPCPIIPFLEELRENKIDFGFQVTITPYGRDVEPGVPDKSEITEAFRRISDKIGKERMIWRYDPIIINDNTGIEYHKKEFGALCKELSGYTERCIFSFVELHEKLKGQSKKGTIRNASLEEVNAIGSSFSEISKSCEMELTICCSEHDLSKYGISSRGCIDKDTMRALGIPFESVRVPLREGCKCIKNVDIGEYDTCDHDCIYCYANRNTDKVRKRKVYDKHSEMLFGRVNDSDIIIESSKRKNSKITDF